MARGGPADVLLRLKAEGVIAHVGVAGGPIDLMIRYVETGAFEAVITHNRYTLIDRSAEPLLEAASRRGLGISNAAPYGSGILAKGADQYPRYMYGQATDAQLAQVRRIEAVCRRHAVPLAAAALQFSLRDPRVSATIIGMSKPERIAETATLATHAIPAALWAEIDTALAGA